MVTEHVKKHMLFAFSNPSATCHRQLCHALQTFSSYLFDIETAPLWAHQAWLCVATATENSSHAFSFLSMSVELSLCQRSGGSCTSEGTSMLFPRQLCRWVGYGWTHQALIIKIISGLESFCVEFICFSSVRLKDMLDTFSKIIILQKRRTNVKFRNAANFQSELLLSQVVKCADLYSRVVSCRKLSSCHFKTTK